MRPRFSFFRFLAHLSAVALVLTVVMRSFAADATEAGAAVVAGEASRFTETQREYIHSYILQNLPDFPREVAVVTVERFLSELQRRSPGEFDRLLSPDFPLRKYRSLLFQLIGAQLTGPAQVALREEVARKRLEAILESQAVGKVVGALDAATALAKIKAMAPVHPRRLVEGRMDDDEVELLLRKDREAGAAPAPAKPKVLTAADIVAEFGRRNQEGAAWQKLRALTIHSRLQTAAGEELEVFLLRMRPDRFRMTIVAAGATRFVISYDGAKYWQQAPGRPAQEIPAKTVGASRYLSEFVDPLVADSGVGFERLPDGADGAAKTYRLSVRRADGSTYVAWIDQETFRQIGRETEDKQIIRYSDFRMVGGIALAFREESTDAKGGKAVLTLVRATPDAGLIQALFEPAGAGAPDYFALERMLAGATPIPAK